MGVYEVECNPFTNFYICTPQIRMECDCIIRFIVRVTLITDKRTFKSYKERIAIPTIVVKWFRHFEGKLLIRGSNYIGLNIRRLDSWSPEINDIDYLILNLILIINSDGILGTVYCVCSFIKNQATNRHKKFVSIIQISCIWK